jgi:hypothetical protein
MGQSNSTVVGTSTEKSVEAGFDLTSLKANAAVYHDAKRIVDAASGFDSLDDAIAALSHAWKVLESQIEDGGGFTPPVDAGFGSDSAAVIGESILGRRNTVGATRKAFNDMGK